MSLLLIRFDERNGKVPRESYFVQYGKDQMAVSKSRDCATKSAVDHFDPHGQSICCWCCVSECKPLWLWIFDLSEERAGPVERYTQKYGDALSSAWWICNRYLCTFAITTNNQHALTTRNNSRNGNRSAHCIHLFPIVRYYRLNFKCFS